MVGPFSPQGFCSIDSAFWRIQSIAEWDVTAVTLSLLDSTLPTLCFMAPGSSPRLLGAVTLEEFGLGVDPIEKRLIPVKTYLT